MILKAYECYGKLSEEGYIDIPGEIKRQLNKKTPIKLIILTDEDKPKNKYIQALNELNGLLSDMDKKELKDFENILKDRPNFKRKISDLRNMQRTPCG